MSESPTDAIAIFATWKEAQTICKWKPFSCTECKYETDTKYYLQNHKRTMHVAKEGLWICAKGKCAENPRSFINNHLLKKHQDCHEEIKCEKCDKKITAKRNFRRHIKTVHKDNLEERNVTVSVNIAHIDPEDVAVGDLVVVVLTLPLLTPWPMTDCQIMSCH